MISQYIAPVRVPLAAVHRRGGSTPAMFAGLRRWLYRVVPRQRRVPDSAQVRSG